jgi:hypothetical protein
LPTDILLSWQAGDPDGDVLTYDIAFGTANPPPFVMTGVLTTIFDPGPLLPGATYYWRVTASDGYTSTEGAVWSFNTQPLVYDIYLPVIRRE